jgi:hypothetical protein
MSRRTLASASPAREHFLIFELGVEAAMSTVSGGRWTTHRERWRAT